VIRPANSRFPVFNNSPEKCLTYLQIGFMTVSSRKARSTQKAFTMIEMLAAGAVIAVLAGLLIPAALSARHTKNLATDMSNLRQIGLAHQRYVSDNNMKVIEGFRPASGGSPLKLWFIDLRPYLDGQTSMATACRVLTSPLDPKKGGLNLNYEGKRRSYNVNRGLTEGTGTARKARSVLNIDNPASVILAGWHNWHEVNTNVIMNDVQSSLDLIPVDWGNGFAQFVYLDGHVARVEVSSLMPGGENYWHWTGVK
jgi:prepilin-type N-terminal cleavage/methylation domain-containing protein/prepilin-type processing-associated H-X9-DG protein